ncbi:response regulator [Chachezhania antarctica]|uniref:response regulator n=1 Tax=Chachezhania antarctica TaxID=2340860 RepID=UPI001F08FBEA|nr:response regulator [Chachezhania antarctica]
MNDRNKIMIVEDNDDDYEACVVALTQDNNLANTLQRCTTGDAALEFLMGAREGNSRHQLPSLILLDLNLPGTDGREVLQQIKADKALRMIPVVVMTTSKDEHDIQDCYMAGANSYVLKPVDLQGFFEAVARLRDYWFQIVILPDPG